MAEEELRRVLEGLNGAATSPLGGGEGECVKTSSMGAEGEVQQLLLQGSLADGLGVGSQTAGASEVGDGSAGAGAQPLGPVRATDAMPAAPSTTTTTTEGAETAAADDGAGGGSGGGSGGSGSETWQARVIEHKRRRYGVGVAMGEEERERNQEHVDRFGRALLKISTELYSRDSHFVLELVQNAGEGVCVVYAECRCMQSGVGITATPHT